MPSPPLPEEADLAPGDSSSVALSLSSFAIERIRRLNHPRFETAYAALWREFGQKGQMETREMLAARFAQAPALCYEIVLVRHEGALAAVRDHTVIEAADEVIVHLSHLLVAPEYRGSGLAGWMRAFPAAFAREIAPGRPPMLVAELDHPDPCDEGSIRRLRSYERAGFRTVDSRMIPYYQPDFRAPEMIAASGAPQPVPLQLCLREVGRPPLEALSGARLRRIVAALYQIYGVPNDGAMHPALDLRRYPAEAAVVRMFPLTTPDQR